MANRDRIAYGNSIAICMAKYRQSQRSVCVEVSKSAGSELFPAILAAKSYFLHTAKSMKWITKISPPLLYKICIGAMLISRAFNLNDRLPLPYSISGLLLLLSGSLLALRAKSRFKRTNTPISPNAKPEKLHMCGVFNYTRNPMYLGIVIGLLGIAIATGILYNLVYPLFYFFVMDRYFIKKEEQNLQQKFGNVYHQYQLKTRRWI